MRFIKRLILCAILFLGCVSTLLAQDAQPTSSTAASPSTKLETFQAKTGAVIIRGFADVGTLRGSFGGSVSVSSREIIDAGNRNRIFGVLIEVKEGGRIEREDRSYVDYDEISSLIEGIDYIAKVTSEVTKLSSFEASYRTKGDLQITTFSGKRNEGVSAAISSGRIGRASVFIKLEDLAEFKRLVTEAKAKLDAIK